MMLVEKLEAAWERVWEAEACKLHAMDAMRDDKLKRLKCKYAMLKEQLKLKGEVVSEGESETEAESSETEPESEAEPEPEPEPEIIEDVPSLCASNSLFPST